MVVVRYGNDVPSKPGFFVESGLHPAGKGQLDFSILQSQVRHYMRYGPAHKFFDSLLIPGVLSNPAAIFQGLKRENMEDGLCYVAIPPVRYINARVTAPPHPGKTFAVFADAKFEVFDWRWENTDSNDKNLPMDYQTRFSKKVWPV